MKSDNRKLGFTGAMRFAVPRWIEALNAGEELATLQLPEPPPTRILVATARGIIDARVRSEREADGVLHPWASVQLVRHFQDNPENEGPIVRRVHLLDMFIGESDAGRIDAWNEFVDAVDEQVARARQI